MSEKPCADPLVCPSQANLKRFMEHVHQKNVEKVSKWLEKGLDPNFHDSDSGGVYTVFQRGRPLRNVARTSGEKVPLCAEMGARPCLVVVFSRQTNVTTKTALNGILIKYDFKTDMLLM